MKKYTIEEVSYTKSLLEKASESRYYRPYLESCFNAIILASYDKEMATVLYSDYLEICSSLEELNTEGLMPLIEGMEYRKIHGEEADEIDW